MLNKPIESILYDAEGKVRGVRSEGQDAYCKQLIADPSYFMGTDKVKKTHQIARCIVILNAPMPNTNADSAQIIIPAKQIDDGKSRKKDMYICMVSYLHKVVPEGKYVAVMSAEVESKDPIPALEKDAKGCEAGCKRELGFALKLLPQGAKDIAQTFFWVTECYGPTSDGKKDNVFLSSSYDATTHFESASREVLRLYEDITGKKLDLSIPPEPDREEEPEAGEDGDVKDGKEAKGGGFEAASPVASGDMSAAEVEAALAKELAKDKGAAPAGAQGAGGAS
jgi:Rab GDP dissociation inhibitor